MFNMMTLDGFLEGPNHDLSWHNVDAEFNDFATRQLDEIGALLFGRVTFQMMASYWPTPVAIESDPEVAGRMNALPKFVFSRTLDQAGWENATLVRGNAEEEVARLTQEPGKDLAIFGSGDLAASLLPSGLIDEFRIMINPVLLGRGKPLFQNAGEHKLKVVRTRTFESGNVLLVYQNY